MSNYSSVKRPLPFIVILLAFLCLALGFAFNTPYRTEGRLIFQQGVSKDIGAPDERQHANYVKRLMEGKSLPILDPEDPELYENYQAHQPPLYYYLAAGFGAVSGADPADPQSGSRLRFLSVILGMAAVTGIYFLVKWADGRDEVAWAAMTLGLMPMFLGLSSAVSNDPLLYAAITWTCALVVRAMKQGGAWKDLAVLGLVAAVAFGSKTTSLALIPVLLTALALTWKEPKGQKLVIGGGLLLALALASPIWLRNMSLYGDPFALKVFQASFTGSAQASTFIESFGAAGYWTQWVAWWTVRSLIGVFGYMDIYLFETLGQAKFNQIYLALAFLFGIILALGLVPAKSSREEEEEDDSEPHPKALWPLAVLGIVVLLLFIQFNRTYFQGQGRYLYPALPLLALFWGRGLVFAFKGRPGAWIAGAAILGGLSLLFLSQLPQSFKVRTASPSSEVSHRYNQPSNGTSSGELPLLLAEARHEMPRG